MPDMSDAGIGDDDCQHISVARCTDDPAMKNYVEMWVCNDCGMEFFSAEKFDDSNTKIVEAMQQQIQQHNQTTNMALDMIAGTFGAVVWDLQERTFEKYGVKPTPDLQQEPPAPHDCDMDGHVFVDPSTGAFFKSCIHCEAPRFLGGE